MVHHDSGSLSAGDRFERIEQELIAQERDTTQSFGKLWTEIASMKQDHNNRMLEFKLELAESKFKLSMIVAGVTLVIGCIAQWLMKHL